MRGLSARPVVVVDLALNWTEVDGDVLQLVRLRSDRFDPRALVPDATDAMAAFRALLAALLDRTGAVALPDPDAARGTPFRSFDDLAGYQREVLQVDG